MKKTAIVMFLLLLSLVVLSACTANKQVASSQTTSTTSAQTTPLDGDVNTINADSVGVNSDPNLATMDADLSAADSV